MRTYITLALVCLLGNSAIAEESISQEQAEILAIRDLMRTKSPNRCKDNPDTAKRHREAAIKAETDVVPRRLLIGMAKLESCFEYGVVSRMECSYHDFDGVEYHIFGESFPAFEDAKDYAKKFKYKLTVTGNHKFKLCKRSTKDRIIKSRIKPKHWEPTFYCGAIQVGGPISWNRCLQFIDDVDLNYAYAAQHLQKWWDDKSCRSYKSDEKRLRCALVGYGGGYKLIKLWQSGKPCRSCQYPDVVLKNLRRLEARERYHVSPRINAGS